MNICIFGDSIAFGAYDEEAGGWVNRLRNYLEGKIDDINVYNLSIPGDTTEELLKRTEMEAKSRQPDMIIFAIGVNDSEIIRSEKTELVPPAEFLENLEKLLVIAKKFTKKIIFVGLTSVDEALTNPVDWNMEAVYTNQNIKKYDVMLERFCENNKLKFIPLNNIIKIEDLFDGVHPNSAGHQKIFEKVKIGVEELV